MSIIIRFMALLVIPSFAPTDEPGSIELRNIGRVGNASPAESGVSHRNQSRGCRSKCTRVNLITTVLCGLSLGMPAACIYFGLCSKCGINSQFTAPSKPACLNGYRCIPESTCDYDDDSFCRLTIIRSNGMLSRAQGYLMRCGACECRSENCNSRTASEIATVMHCASAGKIAPHECIQNRAFMCRMDRGDYNCIYEGGASGLSLGGGIALPAIMNISGY